VSRQSSKFICQGGEYTRSEAIDCIDTVPAARARRMEAYDILRIGHIDIVPAARARRMEAYDILRIGRIDTVPAARARRRRRQAAHDMILDYDVYVGVIDVLYTMHTFYIGIRY
jgi:hypothetical protein